MTLERPINHELVASEAREVRDAAMERIAELEAERAELLLRAFKFDDKPHQLFSFVRTMAEGHEHQVEIEVLMDLAYENAHRFLGGGS